MAIDEWEERWKCSGLLLIFAVVVMTAAFMIRWAVGAVRRSEPPNPPHD